MISDDNGDTDLDRLTGFLKLHSSPAHAHFLLSETSSEAETPIINEFYCMKIIISTKSDFADGRVFSLLHLFSFSSIDFL